jgi:hypothetical protein
LLLVLVVVSSHACCLAHSDPHLVFSGLMRLV